MIDLQRTCDKLAESGIDIQHCTGGNFSGRAVLQQSTFSLLISYGSIQ